MCFACIYSLFMNLNVRRERASPYDCASNLPLLFTQLVCMYGDYALRLLIIIISSCILRSLWQIYCGILLLYKRLFVRRSDEKMGYFVRGARWTFLRIEAFFRLHSVELHIANIVCDAKKLTLFIRTILGTRIDAIFGKSMSKFKCVQLWADSATKNNSGQLNSEAHKPHNILAYGIIIYLSAEKHVDISTSVCPSHLPSLYPTAANEID